MANSQARRPGIFENGPPLVKGPVEGMHPNPDFDWDEWVAASDCVADPRFPHIHYVNDGLAFGEYGEHYPAPMDHSLYTLPYAPSLGQVSVGDVFAFILGGINSFIAHPIGSMVFHYVVSKVPASTELTTLAKAFGTAVTAYFKVTNSSSGIKGVQGLYNPKVNIGPGEVKSLKDSTDAASTAIDVTGADAVATGTVPLRSATVVRLGTAKKGRSFQGRKYLFAIDESRQRAGQVDSDSLAVLSKFAEDMRVVSPLPVGNEWTQGVYSAVKSKGQPSPIVTPVTTTLVRSIQGSQRRRQRVVVR